MIEFFQMIINEIEREISLFATCDYTYYIMILGTFIVMFNFLRFKAWKRF